jgi:hypothetical protein
MVMRLVVIESPYAGDVEANEAYARDCMADCLRRGEAPYASHLLYTQMLNDTVPDQRKLGMAAGFAWNAQADAAVVYVDRGISPGMVEGIMVHQGNDVPVEFRRLGGAEVTP